MNTLEKLQKLQRVADLCDIESDIGSLFSYEDFLLAREALPDLLAVVGAAWAYKDRTYVDHEDAYTRLNAALAKLEEVQG